MPDYDNNLQGALFRNDKDGNAKAPDYKGPAEIDGVEYDMSAWINESKSGKKYMKLKFEVKGGGAGVARSTAPAQAATKPPDDDDIPF